jgi:alkylation response protein AidB-like acyl-CoA dehydrogenase
MVHPYRLSESDSAHLDSATAIAREVLAPNAADVDREARYPREGIDALGQTGLAGLTVDRKHGGEGGGMRAFAAVVEELATACGSTAMIYNMHVSASQTIAAAASLSDRDALLREIAAGRHLTTLAFSERGSRSQFWMPVSKLEAVGGKFVTSADKSWVTSAHEADSFVSSALAPASSGPMDWTIYLVRKDARGVTVTTGFDGLGLRGNDSAPMRFERVAVAEGDLLSAQGEGATTMLTVVLPWFAIGTAAIANGLCRSVVDATTRHLSSAGFETSGAQLRDLPNLRARVAEMAVRTEQSRALLGHAFDHIESGSPAAPLYVLQSRLAAIQAAADVTDLAMKACGGAAFSRQLGVERVFRDARAGWVMAPTVDHLLEFTGRALTGLPLF